MGVSPMPRCRPWVSDGVVHRARAFVRAWVVVVVGALLVAGCGDSSPDGAAVVPAAPGPGSPVAVGAPEPSAPAVACGEADLESLRTRVMVSTSGSDAASCGSTPANACQTIATGLSRCSGTACGVLVRHGRYPTSATLVLRDGMHLIGSCRFPGDAATKPYRTVIDARPTDGGPAVRATGITAATRVEGLVVAAGDAAPGRSSVAMAVEASPGLVLRRTVLSAGRGGDGVTGGVATAGAGEYGSSSSNVSSGRGSPGGRACADNPLGSVGHGGSGGDGMAGAVGACFFTCDCKYPNLDASVGTAGRASGAIVGGAHGDRAYGGASCSGPAAPGDFVGKNGSPGAEGACSRAGGPRSADAWGTVGAGGWQAGSGGAGAQGEVGSGGGGGSSGGYCAVLYSIFNVDHFINGVPGGSGGGGGCGGAGGAGGPQGGLSSALWLRDTSAAGLSDASNVFVAGPGGDGAAGSAGSPGGPGGGGGNGGSGHHELNGDYSCPGPSGRGGDGGPGGAGAGGAGGNGGPSVAVALLGSASASGSLPNVYLGKPGLGNAGGNGGHNPNGCQGAGGAAGIGGAAGGVVPLGAPPQNVLTAGDVLTAGQVRTSPDGMQQLRMQDDQNLCFYSRGSYRWCFQQVHKVSGVRLAMQTDGNLCLLASNGSPSWCASTAGHSGAYLAVRDAGDVVIFDGTYMLATLP